MQSKDSNFVAPKHWVGIEELNPEYWTDKKAQEARGQEFLHKPIETIEMLEKLDTKGIARRDFLTIMGASMAMASFACARRPVNKIIPYVVKPEQITPGVPDWYASTCRECSSNCGTLVKTREGRPIKMEGNPDHTLSKGKLCGRGQASILNLYDPDRLQAPIHQKRGSGSSPATWAEADAEVVARIKSARAEGGGVRVLSGSTIGPSAQKLVQEFSGLVGPLMGLSYYDVLSLGALSEGQEVSYGTPAGSEWTTPSYRFEDAEVIVSLGADFLGHWLSSVENQANWSKRRKIDGVKAAQASMSKTYVFEADFSVTGANADERFSLRPGDELSVALALAYEIVVAGGKSNFAGQSAVVNLLKNFKPDLVCAAIGGGITPAKIKEIADVLWSQRGKGIVVGGGLSSDSGNGIQLQIAVNFLNSVLGNEGSTIDGTTAPHATQVSNSGLAQLVAEMKAGKVSVLILNEVNPVYTSALGAEFIEALGKVKTVISLADHLDESAVNADWVLPLSHALESWGDAQPAKGLYSLQQPVVAPLYSTRSYEEVILTWASLLKGAPIAPTWHDYLQRVWQQTLYSKAGAGRSPSAFWEQSLEKGVLDLRTRFTGGARTFRVNALDRITKPVLAPSGETITIALYAKIPMADGRSANNAWLQEMPDPITTVTWDNYLNVSPAMAQRLSIADNEIVRVQTEGGKSFDVPAHLQPGLHSQVVSIAIGYGRTHGGRVGTGVGVHAQAFALTGQKVKIQKTGMRYELAATQGHNRTEGRPIVNDISLAEYRKDPKTTIESEPPIRMEVVPSAWPKHEYKGYRWGMAIDLNACTGCNACVIACQSENNIPVVGRNNVRVSREMHWIRIDRYYAGAPESPEVVFQPMLCQHCENASCETVCPVLATVHSSEGLNEQVYNRCVGTRYCQNNCPYKVRRFNFFDHWKNYTGNMNLAWNPDVTVRTRGIMEKCTFCVQRIQYARDDAKKRSTTIKDGDFKTACQQTCPSDAITFGDINDPKSRVSVLRADARAFRSLESVNNQPSISYLSKVRNRVNEGAHHDSHE